MTICKRFLKSNLSFIAILFLASLAFGQVENAALTNSDLSPLLGNWTGTLSYLDYSDDSSRVVLDARMTARVDDGVFKMKTTVAEQNGTEQTTESTWSVSKDGRKMVLDGKSWFVSDKKTTDNGTTIVFQAPGLDNNKPAQIMNVLYIGHGDSCIWRKQVLYDGGGHEFVRNEYRFGRVNEGTSVDEKTGE